MGRQGEALRSFRAGGANDPPRTRSPAGRRQSRANTRYGGDALKRKCCRRSRNSESASFHTAPWAEDSSRERWTKTRHSTVSDFRNILPRFTPEARKANQALVDLLRRDRKTKEGDTRSDRAGLVACPEAVDCSNSWHHETASPGRKYRSSINRTYARRSPRHRKRCIKNLCARSPIPATH